MVVENEESGFIKGGLVYKEIGLYAGLLPLVLETVVI